MRLEMFADETLTWWFPFDGLPDGATPDVSLGGSAYTPMTLAPTYGDALDDADPNKDSAWYSVSFAGPDSGAGTVVPLGWSRIVFRVVSGGVVDVKPDPSEPAIWLVVTRRSVAA